MAQTFPTKLGRYQIVKHLANGGMAQVLVARATGIEGFERHVVVKRIHTERAEDPVFVKMFLDEARLAAQLHHNNIVQVHDIGKEKGEYFFAMEYVHGEDLRKLLMKVNKKKEKVPFEHLVTIVTTVALALHHAHEQRGADRKPLGLVHRDVSPANIIVGYDGNVKVVDFGIAKAALRTTQESTKAGALKGKVSYMSPEQCAGGTVDRRSDVYSLGIVLFELATVRRLFKGNNDFLTMSAIVQGNVPKPSSYRADIPPELEAIILKALALDPANRYQTADDMREALEQFAAAKGLRTSTGSLASYMKQLFGLRPEPWLVDDGPELDLTVDFDGAEAGVAAVPDAAVHELAVPSLVEPTPSSPILQARTKAATDANALKKPGVPRAPLPPPSLGARKTPVPRATPPPIPGLDADTVIEPTMDRADATPDVVVTPLTPKPPVLPEVPETTKLDRVKDDGWTNGQPTTGSGTPLAWPTDATAAPTSSAKKKLFAIGGAGVLALAAVIFVVTRSGGEEPGGPPAPPAVSPAKVSAPEPEPPAPEPPPPVEPTGTGSAVEPVDDPANIASEPPEPDAGTAAPEVAIDIEEQTEEQTETETKPATDIAGSTPASSKPKPRKKKVKKPKQWTSDELFLPDMKK